MVVPQGSEPKKKKAEADASLFKVSENSLNLLVVVAVIGGVLLGAHIRQGTWSTPVLMYLDIPGELYMRMLESLVIPLVSSSVIAALGSIDIVLAGHIGVLSLLYFLLATSMATSIGIAVAYQLQSWNKPCWSRRRATTADALLDLLRNIFPSNFVEACIYTTVTIGRNATDEDDIAISKESRSNMLGILSVSILLGAVLSVTGTESNALLNLFIGLSNASVTISHLIAWYSPVGIFFLVATRSSQVRDTGRVFRSILEYVLTALACLLLYGLVFLPALYAAVTRRSLRRFLRLTTSPMLKAVRSASRAVSMPETIDVLEEIEELEPRIVRFVIPVGANVSMSGTAVVVSVAAVFLAKFNGLELGPEDMIGIGTTTLFASLGAASIPNSSVLTLLMILRTLELPNNDISLVFAADCIIDRFRIAANIFTDSVGSAVVQQFSRLESLEDTVDESIPPLPGLGLTSDVLRCLPGAEIPHGSPPVVHRHREASDTVLLEVQDHQQSIAFGQHSQQGMVLPKRHQRKQDLSDDRHSRGIMKSSPTLHDRRRHHRRKKKASRLVEVPEAARGDEDSQPSKKPKEQKYHKRRHHRPKRAKDANASSTAIKDGTTEQTASSMVPPSVLAQLGRRTSSSTAVKPET